MITVASLCYVSVSLALPSLSHSLSLYYISVYIPLSIPPLQLQKIQANHSSITIPGEHEVPPARVLPLEGTKRRHPDQARPFPEEKLGGVRFPSEDDAGRKQVRGCVLARESEEQGPQRRGDSFSVDEGRWG